VWVGVHGNHTATYDSEVVFRTSPVKAGTSPGHVDYRLARASILSDFRLGLLDREDVCDAHPELVRAARELGTEVPGACPICEQPQLVNVTYVFGPRLPHHGRCISMRGELARLAKRPGVHIAYVVEVCRGCSWNYLVRRSTLTPPEPESMPGVATVKGEAELD
jgi:hypothetical protein